MDNSTNQASKKLLSSPDFNPSDYLRPGYTELDIIELKNAFDTFDTDKSGSIDIKEMKEAIGNLELESASSAILQLVLDFDSDNSGKIEFSEFLDLVSGKTGDESSKEEIQKVFNVFDKDKTGQISFENLKTLVQDLGLQLSDSTLKNLISKGDSNYDGLVNFEDFYLIMSRTVV